MKKKKVIMIIWIILTVLYFGISFIRNTFAEKPYVTIDGMGIQADRGKINELKYNDYTAYYYSWDHKFILQSLSGYSFWDKFKHAYTAYNKFGTNMRVEFTELYSNFDLVPFEYQNRFSTRLHPLHMTMIDLMCRREWYYIIIRYLVFIYIIFHIYLIVYFIKTKKVSTNT